MRGREHDGNEAKRSPGERLLNLFGEVRRDEVPGVVLLTLAAFLQLAAYYLLKVVREPLVMMAGGAEVKRYAAAAQTAVLFGIVELYAVLASRLGRLQLIGTVNLFCVVSLLVFCGLGLAEVAIGVPFFIWVGVFNVTLVAQFWAFANDLYDQNRGRRLFGVIGIGGSIGAVAGSSLGGWLYRQIGPHLMMAVAAAILVIYVAVLVPVNRRDRAAHQSVSPAQAPLREGGGFQLLRRDRYLLLVALLTLVVDWVNTIGEYVLDRELGDAARSAAAGQADPKRVAGEFIGGFRATFFGWVNLTSLLLQSFAVSRVIGKLGVLPSLFVTPTVSLGGYSAMGLMPVLGVTAVAKAVENSLGYSLQNTAQQALFLVTSREAKYKAKTIADTFFRRVGDVLSAVVIAVGSLTGLGTTAFTWLAVGLVVLWLWLMFLLERAYGRRVAARAREPAGERATEPS